MAGAIRVQAIDICTPMLPLPSSIILRERIWGKCICCFNAAVSPLVLGMNQLRLVFWFLIDLYSCAGAKTRQAWRVEALKPLSHVALPIIARAVQCTAILCYAYESAISRPLRSAVHAAVCSHWKGNHSAPLLPHCYLLCTLLHRAIASFKLAPNTVLDPTITRVHVVFQWYS
eukprot:6173170-Pleurochrysis_carterae.AAC.2